MLLYKNLNQNMYFQLLELVVRRKLNKFLFDKFLRIIEIEGAVNTCWNKQVNHNNE